MAVKGLALKLLLAIALAVILGAVAGGTAYLVKSAPERNAQKELQTEASAVLRDVLKAEEENKELALSMSQLDRVTVLAQIGGSMIVVVRGDTTFQGESYLYDVRYNMNSYQYADLQSSAKTIIDNYLPVSAELRRKQRAARNIAGLSAVATFGLLSVWIFLSTRRKVVQSRQAPNSKI